MNSNEKSFLRLFFTNGWVLVGFFIIGLAIFYEISTAKKLQETGRYNIGKVLSMGSNLLGTSYYYEYSVRGRKYHREVIISRSKAVLNATGKKYLVIYNPSNPKTSALVISKEVLKTINLDSLNKLGIQEEVTYWGKAL